MNAYSPGQVLAVAIVSLIPFAAAAQRIVWHKSMEIAAGAGERGPWQQNESRYRYVDDPTVALDEEGAVAIAWVDQSQKDVLFQRIDTAGSRLPPKPINVSRSPDTFSWLPRITLSPQDPQQIYILWQEIIFSGGSHGGDILFSRSHDGGRTFAEPVNLSKSVGGDGKGRISEHIWHNGSLDIAAGADGAVFAAWTEYRGPLWFSRSGNAGQSFSKPVRIAGTQTEPARAPELALDPKGAVYLAWTVGEDESADIRIAKSTDSSTTFSTPQIIEESKGYSDAPKLAVTSDGVLHLVYAESSGGPFARSHIRYTHSTDGARTFTAPHALTKPAPISVASAAFPALDTDAQGNLYVIWERYLHFQQRSRGLEFATSSDGGRTFTAPLEVPGSADPSGSPNGSFQGLLMQKLAVNDAGSLVVANSSLKDGEHSRVWIIRGERARKVSER